jgi:hypothetical protein
MIKVKYQEEIHLVKLHPTFARVAASARTAFKRLPQDLHFVYRDEDNDEIIVNCDHDLQVLLEQFAQERGRKMLKLEARESLYAINDQEDLAFSSFLDLQPSNQDSSVELLEEERSQQLCESLYEECVSEQSYVLPCSEVLQCEASVDVGRLVRESLLKVEGKIIGTVLQRERAAEGEAVEDYFQNLYANLEKISMDTLEDELDPNSDAPLHFE